MRTILAIGGGGFLMEGALSPIDRHLLHLTVKTRQRVCVIPTPTGDSQDVIDAFYAAFDPFAQTAQLTPFRKPTARSIGLRAIAESLCEQDAVYVTGGNTTSALAVWREWGIDTALRAAYERGVIICGMSAGAVAWFDFAFSDSWNDGGFAPLQGLGWLPGGACPHAGSEGGIRARALDAAVRTGAMPASVAIDDYAAVLFQNETLAERINWRVGSDVRYVVQSNEQMQTLAVPLRRL